MCHSESLLSLEAGAQAAFRALGGVTAHLQTDRSSTATHRLERGEAARGFNTEYLAFCTHVGVTPRTIAVAYPNRNGDVEAAQGTPKRRLKNHLALRRSGDFASEAAYAAFVAQVCTAVNPTRTQRAAEEVARLRPLPATRYPQTEEHALRVSSFSTVRVEQAAYSVPSRLIGARVKAYVSETEAASGTRASRSCAVPGSAPGASASTSVTSSLRCSANPAPRRRQLAAIPRRFITARPTSRAA